MQVAVAVVALRAVVPPPSRVAARPLPWDNRAARRLYLLAVAARQPSAAEAVVSAATLAHRAMLGVLPLPQPIRGVVRVDHRGAIPRGTNMVRAWAIGVRRLVEPLVEAVAWRSPIRNNRARAEPLIGPHRSIAGPISVVAGVAADEKPSLLAAVLVVPSLKLAEATANRERTSHIAGTANVNGTPVSDALLAATRIIERPDMGATVGVIHSAVEVTRSTVAVMLVADIALTVGVIHSTAAVTRSAVGDMLVVEMGITDIAVPATVAQGMGTAIMEEAPVFTVGKHTAVSPTTIGPLRVVGLPTAAKLFG